MELKLTVEQFAKINEMGLTAEQVQEVVNLVMPEEPETQPEPVNIPDYSESFTAISKKLESLQEQISKTSIINSGSENKAEANTEASIIEFLNTTI